MRQEQRTKRRKRVGLLQVGAIALSFGLGLGTTWWFTDGSQTPASVAGSDSESVAPDPSTFLPSPHSGSSTDPGESESVDETVGPLSMPPESHALPSPSFTDKFPEPLVSITEDDIVKTGSGNFIVASGESEPSGTNPTKYRVEIEEDLPFHVDDTAAFIDDTLADPRGWGAEGKHAFQRVSDDSFDFRILIATPDTVDELCAPLRTNGKVSCGRAGRATLNAVRWAVGSESFGTDVENYRRYLIAHEFGHLLAYQHEDCPGPGEVAPVMVQQTISTQGCEPNPWPFPDPKTD